MTGHVVIEHHHDEADGTYRLVVGVPVTQEVAVVDDDGEPVLDGDEPVVEQQLVRYEDVHEVAWADDDERWYHADALGRRRRRASGEVAAEQREEVAARLAERAGEAVRERERVEASRKPMPGAGGALTEGI